ncbi:helix-turn-helix transcriptional regulator [Kroppenstedtia pulmonis]|uniref:Helix-turn-helix transcriptional regulator n=1 Tax=Kroppenstedtia pulmonis TaxID=1380685 RepID=A0A7D3XZ49_9BACL|nr:tetratricopeptide repeat protein [Kroppenstedtia pulmonis]QKG83360.1 helix-turn-helix transcriptional regulator [Kroppenstedtia pulmonis]
MSLPAIREVGEVIRRIRKRKGLRLEDLADENISPATISNIERGVHHVNQEKTRYLLRKLAIGMDKLPDLILGEKKELKDLQFRFMVIESLCEAGKIKEALDRLEQLGLEDSHPFAGILYYLRGKCLARKGDWKKAERNFYKGMQLSHLNQHLTMSNLETACFSDLAVCCYHQNDLEKALQFTDSGIDAFVSNGERQYLWHLMHRNKGIYLERMGRIAEGLKLVQDLWEELPRTTDIDTHLGFYWLRSELLRRGGMYDEAIRFAEEGISLARISRKADSLFSLWSVLGECYMDLKEWEQAEECFEVTMKYEEHLSDKMKLCNTYTKIGLLRMKQGKMTEAFHAIDTSIQYGETYQDYPRLTYASILMGHYHREQRRRHEAVRYYQQALELARKHQYRTLEHRALFHLAQCWNGEDEREFQKYMREIYRIQELMRKKGDFFDEVE